MKYKYQLLTKDYNVKWKDIKLSAYLPISTCLFLVFFACGPVYTQRGSPDIDQLRTKVEEAFIPDLVVLSTAVIESTEDYPEHLLIRGYTMPSNYFQIRMPLYTWNEKNFVSGCGAGCGTLPADISGNLKQALQRGYTTTAINAGHWSKSIFDFSWAYNNPQGEIDYAYRAVHEAQRATVEISKIFYEQEPKYSYFWGCSGGGRQAVMAASRYPKDFDGIISEAPAIDITGETLLLVWLRQTNTGSDGKDILTKEDIPLISQVVYETCDGMDGQEDGLIGTSGPCRFDPAVLICQNGNTQGCLSREKVEVLKQWYKGPVNSKGEKLFVSGIPVGSEPFWGLWLLGETNEPFDELLNSESMLQYTAFEEDPGRNYSVFAFDFDSDPDRMKYMGSLMNVHDLPLHSFENEGGKLLMFHGLADPAIPFASSVKYYENNLGKYGDSMGNFFRLFLIPGMDHCAALSTLGITDESVDPLTSLEEWVEKNNPPIELPVTRYENDGTVKSQFSVPVYGTKK